MQHVAPKKNWLCNCCWSCQQRLLLWQMLLLLLLLLLALLLLLFSAAAVAAAPPTPQLTHCRLWGSSISFVQRMSCLLAPSPSSLSIYNVWEKPLTPHIWQFYQLKQHFFRSSFPSLSAPLFLTSLIRAPAFLFDFFPPPHLCLPRLLPPLCLEGNSNG